MTRLDVQIAGNRVVLAGRLDDEFSHAELVGRIPAGDVVIDTGGVVFVNSIGMREWMRLVRALHEPEAAGTMSSATASSGRRRRVVLERVADVLMAQMNMMSGFAASVTVVSFHAPYVCPACGGEGAPLVDAVAHAQALRALEAPPVPCPECGAVMELGDFPERYLSLFRAE